MSSLLRVLGAIGGAYVIVAVLVFLGSSAAMAVLGVDSASGPDTGYLVANMLVSFVATGIGGYLAARLAPPGLVTVTIAGLMLAIVLLGAATARMAGKSAQPVWYLAVVIVMGASAVLIGAMIQRSVAAGHHR